METDIISDLKNYREKKGILSTEDIIQISKKHNMTIADVYSISTFYSETSPEQRGKYKINLCKSLPCEMKNMNEVLKILQEELHITPGGVTENGMFSLHMVNCIGACDIAPAMLINGILYGDLTAASIRRILDALK